MMSVNKHKTDRKYATNDDNAVPSTSTATVKESCKDEVTCDKLEQCNPKMFKEKSKKTDGQHKNTNVIGTGPLYSGGGIKNTFHGVSYQMKLPMLYIVRGLKQGCAFQVATEVEVADKLDDLLFLYDKDEIGFFQAKHKLNEKLKITEEQLLNTESDFGVKKYFNSYNKILNEKELTDVLNGRDVIVIMNTNIGIDESVLENFEPVISSPTLSFNKILALGTEEERKNYYIIKKESDLYVKLVHLLEEMEQPGASLFQPPTRMAENLAKVVANNNKKSIKTDELFDRHRDWLLTNVLEVGKEDNKTQVKYFVSFRNNFLNSLEQNVFNFGKIFLETYLKQTKKDNPMSAMNDLSGVKFQVPRNFAAPKNKTVKSGQDKVITFLDRLVFAVKQLNEIELGDKITEEIGDYMGHKDRQSIASKFQSYIQNWAKQKEGRYLTNWDVERQFAAWGYESLNQIKMEDIKKYKCAFKESNEVIKNLSHFLSTKSETLRTHDVLCLYYKESLFSKIKLCQVFETFSRENIGQQFIFCDIADLIELENTIMCPVKAFSSQTCNTLFVTLQDCELKNSEIKILHQLLQVIIETNRNAEAALTNKQGKHLIVSISEKNKSEFIRKLCLNDHKIKCLSLDDFENSFSELDEKSRRQLIEKGFIKLNGKYITGLFSENELDLCIRDEMLFKFILNELEINNTSEERNQYNEEVKKYYANRSLLPIVINKDIEKDVLFRIVRKYALNRDKYDREIVVVSTDERLFDHFCKNNINVHWLKKINNKYVWITSQGSLINLRKYVTALDPDLDSDLDIDSNTDTDDSDTNFDSDTDSDQNSDFNYDSHLKSEDSSNLNAIFNYGCDSDLNLNSELENCIPIANVTDLKTNVVLISANPGMGKSVLLSHIEEQSNKEDNLFVVFKTNLTSTIEKLDSLRKEGYVTLEQAIHFIFISTQIESSQIEESESAFNLLTVQEDGSIAFSPNTRFDPLEQLRAMIFCNLYNKEKIVLLLDGFDEIAPDYSETTLNLLQMLKQTKIRKMWVTTRPYAVTKDLENCLNTFAYTLKPLTENEQLTFFKNFWKNKIKSRHTEVHDFFKSLNMSTLIALHGSNTKQSLNKMVASFMGVPLHCYMLAKVLAKDFTKFCSQNIDDDATITSMTIYDLYSKFFDIKFDEILHNENLKNPKNFSLRQKKKTAENDHGKLALLQIFNKEFLAELISDEDTTTLINSVNSGNEKTGIVTEVVGNEPRFVHRTFAEYFAAHYLAEALISSGENKRKDAARLLLYNSVTSNLEYYNVLFTFFNYIVASRSKSKDIFEAAIRGNIQTLSEIKNVDEIFDPLNRTPMHLVAINLCSVLKKFLDLHQRADLRTTTIMHSYFCNFIQRLCQSMNKCSPDALFTWTPAHYLTMSLGAKKSRTFPFLMNYLSDVTRDILCRTPLMLLILRNLYVYNWIQICNDIPVQHKLVIKYAPSIHEQFTGIYKYIYLSTTDVNVQDKFCKTALHYVLQNDFLPTTIDSIEKKLNSICFLLKQGARIDIPDDRGITPKDLINSLLSDLPIDQLYTYNRQIYYLRTTLDQYNKDDFNQASWSYRITKTVQEYLFDSEIDLEPDEMDEIAPHYTSDQTKVIKLLLRYTLLLQVITNKSPIIPFPDSEVFTLWHLDKLSPIMAEILIEKTDVHVQSTSNDDRDKIVFLLTATKTIASILLSKFPYLVDVADSRGKTALHYAINNKNKPRVTFLIKSKARADIQDNTGKMPAHINKLKVLLNDFEIGFDNHKLNFINKLSSEIATPLVLTMDLHPIRTQTDADFVVHVLRYTINIADVLLSHHPDAINIKDCKGKTALHYAVEEKDATTVCYLINKNARPDILDDEGKYPAHLDKDKLSQYEEKVRESKNDLARTRLQSRLQKYLNSIKKKLDFINKLPFEVTKSLVLTMALVPPVTSSDYRLLKCILDQHETIASVLRAEYPDLLQQLQERKITEK